MKIRIFLICFSALFLANCGSHKKVTNTKKNPGVVLSEPSPEKLPSVNEAAHVQKLKRKNSNLNRYTLKYIENYAPIAVREMYHSKIPASITLAQGILESGNGRSQLALKSNNHFGIKCHLKWQGERVYHDDDKRGECFRKYKYVATSYKDHSAFLSQRKRYAFLFDYNRGNYKKWAKGLKKAGYATDRKYPNKLIKIIENYELYAFDKWNKNDSRQAKNEAGIKKQNIKNYYQVKKGDTLYSLSKKFDTTVDKIKELNNLTTNELSIGQYLLMN